MGHVAVIVFLSQCLTSVQVLTAVRMPARISAFLIIYLGALVTNISASGIDDSEESLSYFVNNKTKTVLKRYKNVTKDSINLEDLIVKNSALGMLMNKAEGLLQMRLLLWADVIGNIALIENQFSWYLENRQNDSNMLVEYAAWLVSHDHGAVAALLEEMKRLVSPLFKKQGLFNLALDFLVSIALMLGFFSSVEVRKRS